MTKKSKEELLEKLRKHKKRNKMTSQGNKCIIARSTMELVYQKKISKENFNEKSTTYNNEDDTEQKKELEKDFFNI